MLSEEVERYRELSGDTNPHTPISRIGGYLDGYERALGQEPCDAISRQAVEDAIYDYSRSCDVNYGQIMEYIDKIPPVTAEPRTGRWILKVEDWNKWTCSECGLSKRTDIHVRLGYNYCPNCGAKMKEGD